MKANRVALVVAPIALMILATISMTATWASASVGSSIKALFAVTSIASWPLGGSNQSRR